MLLLQHLCHAVCGFLRLSSRLTARVACTSILLQACAKMFA